MRDAQVIRNRSNDNEENIFSRFLLITFAILAISVAFVKLESVISNEKAVAEQPQFKKNYLTRAIEKCSAKNVPKLNSKLLQEIFAKLLKDCQRLDLVRPLEVERFLINLRATTRRTTPRTTQRTIGTTRRTTTTTRRVTTSYRPVNPTTRNSTDSTGTTVSTPIFFPPPGDSTPGASAPRPTTNSAASVRFSIVASVLSIIVTKVTLSSST